ncbi:MAG: mannose-1-phosphate guanylyltransferase [Candidatus Omnitrophica bacterium]|nr:mannose-1-phosphate guanylyltransferase [Candidatus Omnitrophota bacterium]
MSRKKAVCRTYAVILVGGKGKRLRPLSKASRPKAFLSVTGDRKTMFRNTLGRIGKLIPPERIIVVANRAHSALVRKDLPKAARRGNIILEPVSRNTAPAIALAAAYLLARKDKDAVMLVLPADHYVPDRAGELKALKSGIDFVANNNDDVIAIVGLRPRSASTEYGYVEVAGSGRIAKVMRFTEKPDRGLAVKYIADGRHLWNAGIFIFKTKTLMGALKKYAPKIFQILQSKDINKSYRQMPDISIDYAVMEKADNVYCVKSSYEWSDLGSFDSLEKALKAESRRFIKKGEKIIKIL